MTNLPQTFSAMTPQWLTETLAAERRSGQPVIAVTVEPLGGPGSFVGDIARLKLSYPAADSGIASLVAKLPTGNEAERRRFDAMGFYRRENAFYRFLAPLASIRVPAAYAILEDFAAADFVLLLEDLQGMRTGDHQTGCSDSEAGLVVAELAKLHSRWWNDTSLDQHATWLPAQSGAQRARSAAWFESAVEAAKGRLDGLVTPAFLEFVEAAAPRAIEVWDLQAKSPVAVAHGDCRLENVLFGAGRTDTQIAWVDWQAVTRGSPLRDLSYFLATNFTEERRRSEGPELVRRYHASLEEHGVQGYTLAQCRQDLRRADLLLAWAVFWVAGSLDPAGSPESQQLLRTIISRQAQALLDADPGGMLGS